MSDERDDGLSGESIEEIVDALATAAVFASVDPETLRRLARASRLVTIRARDVVLHRGDAGDAFYIVRSGLLEVLGDGGERVRLLRAGVPFGELAPLTGEARNATVRAVRDTDVWLLPQQAFNAVLDSDPGFARAMVRALANLVNESRPELHVAARPRVISILSLHAGAPFAPLVDALTRSGDRVQLCDASESGDPADWIKRLEALEHAGDTAVLVATDQRDEWFRFCEREADRVVAVAACGARFEPLAADTNPDLVLCGNPAPGAIARAQDVMPTRSHHLVDAASSRDAIDRAVRRVLGTSVGVVLSGGGARGIAHIGALAALHDAGVVVDRIGGTSMGALVGALAASGRSPATIRTTLHAELVDRKPFADYAIPRVSLIRAGRARAMLERLFGDTTIEELARNYFCVTADLASAERVVHRSGSVVLAVGASMSLPGIAPPVRDGRRLLVDGGVLDNLPVEVMAAENEGPVIAVDVLARGAPGARRAARSGRQAQLPSIVETLARSSTLASRGRADQQRELATLAVVPELSDVGLLEFARFDEIVEAGRRAAEAALAEAPTQLFAHP